MKLDIFHEFSQGAPRPWKVGADRELYDNSLEVAEVADRYGFNCFWSVEHHGTAEVAHMPAPESFLAAVAMRTKQIRIAQGVALTPYTINHPIRIAERAAVLDNLSHGRLEMGFGRSTSKEWAVFGVVEEDTKPMLEETIHIVPRIWTEEVFSYKSERLDIPPVTIVPRVLQQPHPPMWLAGGSPDTFRRAGELGMGMLSATLLQPLSVLANNIQVYREAGRNPQPAGKFVTNRTAAFTFVYCGESEDDVINGGACEAAAWWAMKVTAHYSPPAPENETPVGQHVETREERIARIKSRGQDTPATEVLVKLTLQEPVTAKEFYEAMSAEDQCILGTPDQVTKKMERYANSGLDNLMCLVLGGPSLPHEKIIRSLELIGEKVIPYFRD